MSRQIKIKDIPENYEKLIAPNTSKRISVGMEDKIKEYYQVEIDNIKPYEKQARRVFTESEIQNLADTIKLYGVRQPLTIIRSQEVGKFQVVSGERRLRAAKRAGLTKVPCILINDGNNLEEISLIENIQREDLHPIELANAYNSLSKDYKYGDLTSLSKRIGVSKSHLSEVLSYNSIPNEVKDYLLEKNIRARIILRKVMQCKDIKEVYTYLGLSELNKEKIKDRTLIRITLKKGNITTIVSKWKLSTEQKLQLKDNLEELIREI